MVLNTSDEEHIKYMQGYLKRHKIDHNYDDWYDAWNCPLEQVAVRDYFKELKQLNRLPDDVPWIQEELKRESDL